jgi:hypothetical protein
LALTVMNDKSRIAARTDADVERMGVRPQFPKPKAYLKSFILGPQNWESEDLDRLRRYSRGESESLRYRYDAKGETFEYNAYNVKEDLLRVAIALRWHAIQAALSGTAPWIETWRRACAYDYWAMRMDCRNQLCILNDYRNGKRPQFLGTLALHRLGFCVGNVLALGWADWAADLARRARDALDNDGFFDGGDETHRRTQHFILRLVGNWQGWPERSGPRCAFDTPLFNSLIEQWRAPDPEIVIPLLLAACDRHTHEARPDTNTSWFDLPWRDEWYVPFEVLAFLKLRQINSIAIPDPPTLDHPLMKTPLGQLPDTVPPYTDELLDGLISRVRREYPDL